MRLIVALIGLACVAPGLPQLLPLLRHFREGQACYTPENEAGECTASSSCPHIANIFRTSRRNIARQYLRSAQRSCRSFPIGRDPVVCCGYGYNREIITSTATNLFIPSDPSIPPPVIVDETTRTSNPFLPINPTTATPFVLDTTTATKNKDQTTTRPSIIDFIFPTNPSIIVKPTTEAPSVPTTAPTATTTITSSPPLTSSPSTFEGSESCKSPDLLIGVCIPLQNCEPLKAKLLENPSDDVFRRKLMISNEICKKIDTRVCCPFENQEQFITNPIFPENRNDIPRNLPTMQDGCGYVKREFRKIVGGTTSVIGAWPWIALIGYEDALSQSAFKCGGTLITSRHVLTAAHCIRRDLTFVRLGEHDLTTDTETHHVDVRVARTLKHPKYNQFDGHSDIAMLYLNENVQFSPKITPICLPLAKQLQQKSFVDSHPFVAGWGRTLEGGKRADVLQELQIPVFNNSVCKESYKKQAKLISQQQFDNAVICAGELKGGKDTCQGDSGGPLMITEPYENNLRFHLIGVVSYGIGCARRDTPGVYTRVANFMEWIQNSVADT